MTPLHRLTELTTQRPREIDARLLIRSLLHLPPQPLWTAERPVIRRSSTVIPLVADYPRYSAKTRQIFSKLPVLPRRRTGRPFLRLEGSARRATRCKLPIRMYHTTVECGHIVVQFEDTLHRSASFYRAMLCWCGMRCCRASVCVSVRPSHRIASKRLDRRWHK